MQRILAVIGAFFVVFPLLAHAEDEVLIPEGKFMMGCSKGDSLCDKDEGPAGGVSVFVPAFYIDKYEITVSEYQQCVKAGKCKAPDPEFCNYVVKGHDKHPMNCVKWEDAHEYCEFIGKRLPYEAEWEKAARAGTGTPYPWGTLASCKEAVINDGHTTGSVKDALDGCGEDGTFPVGPRPPNSLGVFDMHGNVVEWVGNWYSPDALGSLYAKGDLKGPPSGDKKVARGGSWDDKAPNLRSSFRDARPVTQWGGSLGFRCARNEK